MIWSVRRTTTAAATPASSAPNANTAMGPNTDSMPVPALGPVVEVREPGAEKQAPLWHVYWNHPEGLGAACRAQTGCFTIAPSNVTCPKCLQVLKDNP